MVSPLTFVNISARQLIPGRTSMDSSFSNNIFTVKLSPSLLLALLADVAIDVTRPFRASSGKATAKTSTF